MDNNRLELKIQALKEGFRNQVAKITDEYEDRIADLRIEITERAQAQAQAQQELENVRAELQRVQEEQQDVAREKEDAKDSD